MLAYVFWHWPRPDVAQDNYERDLATFHKALGANKPPGFLRSMVLRGSRVPWTVAGSPYYEDWYLVDDFGCARSSRSGCRVGPLSGAP